MDPVHPRDHLDEEYVSTGELNRRLDRFEELVKSEFNDVKKVIRELPYVTKELFEYEKTMIVETINKLEVDLKLEVSELRSDFEDESVKRAGQELVLNNRIDDHTRTVRNVIVTVLAVTLGPLVVAMVIEIMRHLEGK